MCKLGHQGTDQVLMAYLAETLQFNTLPCDMQVRAGAIAWPHPEKVSSGKGKAVNRKTFGWAGEDAYFYASCR